jgi:hypothetical protein
MVDDSPEDTPLPPDSGRAKRAPPTIDLEATEVTGEPRNAGGEAQQESTSEGTSAAISAAVSPWVIAPVSGAVAAALVIGVGWILGWPAVPPVTPAPPVNMAVIDDLATRVANIESRTGKSAASAPDPTAAGRVEALEKSLALLHSELTGARAQSEKLAAAVNDLKATPREASAAPDLTAINERLGQVERATRAQGSEAAPANARPADDMPLRRVVAAALLDVSVRQGDSYAAALAAAKSLAANPDELKPLDGFAATGVPHPAALSRELLTLVPKLSPPAEVNSTTGSGLVDRLQAGAAKLVRIERTDQAGNDRGAIVARATAAALRNDFAGARRELNMLAPADRTTAQPWLDKADARDAALAASRQFADETMAALAKPAQ